MSQNATWEPKTAKGQRILAWIGVAFCVLLGINFIYTITHGGGGTGIVLLLVAIVITRNTFIKANKLENNPQTILATRAPSSNSNLVTILFFTAGIMITYALLWLSSRLPSVQMTVFARIVSALALISTIVSLKYKQIAGTILFFCALLTVGFAGLALLNGLIKF